MKILYVGHAMGLRTAAHYYFSPQKLINGFIRSGHLVQVYNDRDQASCATPFRSRSFGARAANRGLYEAVDAYRPDLVVLGHCELITNDTLRELRGLVSGLKIIYRNVDSLVQRGNPDKIRRRAEVVDGIFLTTSGAALQEFATSSCFVAFMPNPIDASIETGRAFERDDHEGDLFLAAGAIDDMKDTRREEVQRIVAGLSDLRLQFFGSVVGKPALFGDAYMTTLVHCKMGLSLDRTDDYWLYASDRMAQYMGNGLLTFVRRGKGFEELFEADEIAFFDGTDDLIETARRLASDDAAWRAVARKGWEKAHRLYDVDRIARYTLERTFEQPFSEDYRWHRL